MSELPEQNEPENQDSLSKSAVERCVMLPAELTAENGAKALLMGEFIEVVELECTACDQDDEDCEVCSGHGSYTYRVPISWTAIKEIYQMVVKNYAT